MTLPDVINGCFEGSGGIFIAMSIRRLYIDKLVRGVSWVPVTFFAVWGYWNLFYYPHLDQWVSFVGGLGIVTTNTIWVGQIIYYLWREPRQETVHYGSAPLPPLDLDQELRDDFGGKSAS
jgi:hypothetical protein